MSSPAPRTTAADWADDLHWSFRHMAELFPHAWIRSRAGSSSAFREDPARLGALSVALPGRTATVDEVLAETDSDAWLVLQGDRIIAEEYFGEMAQSDRHLLMSVSKSVVSIVVGALVDRGLIDVSARVADYIPELHESGYGGATIRDLLDMRSGIRFSEAYLDPASEIRMLDEVAGWAPRRAGGVTSLKEFLASLEQVRDHGGDFDYRSCETDMLGWVCEAAGGQDFATLTSELLWQPLGAESDASLVTDEHGMGLVDGGISATLRDLARFGALVRDRGRALDSTEVVDHTWIDDIFAGGPDSVEAYAAGAEEEARSGGMYRSKFWFLDGRRDVVCCLGIHGQLIYINRTSGVVGVKLSAWALPLDEAKGRAATVMFDTISAALAG